MLDFRQVRKIEEGIGQYGLAVWFADIFLQQNCFEVVIFLRIIVLIYKAFCGKCRILQSIQAHHLALNITMLKKKVQFCVEGSSIVEFIVTSSIVEFIVSNAKVWDIQASALWFGSYISYVDTSYLCIKVEIWITNWYYFVVDTFLCPCCHIHDVSLEYLSWILASWVSMCYIVLRILWWMGNKIKWS